MEKVKSKNVRSIGVRRFHQASVKNSIGRSYKVTFIFNDAIELDGTRKNCSTTSCTVLFVGLESDGSHDCIT